MGRRYPEHFTDPKSPDFDAWVTFDSWDAKALGETIARAAYPTGSVAISPTDDATALWSIEIDGRALGSIRRVELDAPVWAAPAFGVELSLGTLESAQVAPPGENAHRPFPRSSTAVKRYVTMPSTPASEFDLALLVPENVRGDQVEALMRRVSGKLLESVRLFDRYVGPGVEPGFRSLAWRLTFRHAERTLRDREIEARRSDILRALADELNVRQRTG
jgi:phenylalanyl-tRNA synthetase beta chain